MAVTFLLKQSNGFGEPVGGGGQAPVPGEGGQELPSPHHPDEGHFAESGGGSLPGAPLSRGGHPLHSGPRFCSPAGCAVRPGASGDPVLAWQLAGAWASGAVRLELLAQPRWVGGQLSQETRSRRGSLFPSGGWGGGCPDGHSQGLPRAACRQRVAPGRGAC